MKYSYFPGCSLKGTGRAYEESLLPVMKELGAELVELDDWNCCGATAYMAVDEVKACVMASRNLAIAEKAGYKELLAPCSACYTVLNKTKHYLHESPSVETVIQTALKQANLTYGGNVPVRHPLDVLVNDIGLAEIKKHVKQPLKGLKVAPYYGCQIVRPYSTFDDQYNPTSMDRLLEAIVRIGFYICHCGHNIAGMVDCPEVGKYVEKLPGVVLSRDYKYMCSDPGQELIQKDIREFKLNRVVVASCSPLLHEHTFRSAVEAGGLNPFFFHMVNIREHDSWVHTDRKEATEKAKALARAAIRACASTRRSRSRRCPSTRRAGGRRRHRRHPRRADPGQRRQEGLPGRARAVHRRPHGQVRQDLPTLDCAACILTPKMSAVGSHPNITLWSYSEVVKVDGYVGNYTVTVKRKPRYINEDLCTGCQECIDATASTRSRSSPTSSTRASASASRSTSRSRRPRRRSCSSTRRSA
jgi:NAD-dependent dihydropyrimidine dehydrogenase PreA subunit